MALQINYNDTLIYQTSQNIEILKEIDSSVSSIITKTVLVSNAYLKINNFTGDKNKITIYVHIYNKKDGTIITSKSYEFSPTISDTSINFIKQGYEYLKTLDEYKDAIDLLDEGQTA